MSGKRSLQLTFKVIQHQREMFRETFEISFLIYKKRLTFTDVPSNSNNSVSKSNQSISANFQTEWFCIIRS